jgi:hypothetical protein
MVNDLRMEKSLRDLLAETRDDAPSAQNHAVQRSFLVKDPATAGRGKSVEREISKVLV